MLVKALLSVIALNECISRQDPAAASEPRFYVGHQLGYFVFRKVLYRGIPNDIVKVSGRHLRPYVGHLISQVRESIVSFRKSYGQRVKIDTDNACRSRRVEHVRVESVATTKLKYLRACADCQIRVDSAF